MRALGLFGLLTSLTLLAGSPTAALAQAPAPEPEPEDRTAAIEAAQAERAQNLYPYVPDRAERVWTRVENTFVYPTTTWHPFFENAYAGGGFAPGVGYLRHLSSYSTLDVRGSYSIRNYKRIEAEFIAPRLFNRRGHLSVLGGWRDATQVGFYGVGNDTSKDDRANYGFEQPHVSALLTVRPTRQFLVLQGGFELSRWDIKSGAGAFQSVDDVFTPATLPGLDTRTTYLRTLATVGFDWRPASGYARRGGYYGVTAHDYSDRDDQFGFRRVQYEAIQHFPILREAWVISLHGLVQNTWRKGDQQVPFFMLPSLGGGSNLRGFSSWRFRDRNSLLLQAEWRIAVNRFFDTAVFYDTGKVAARTSDIDFNGLKHDYGFGARFHTPFSTVLRIDVARSNEGTSLVFATSPVF
jgi:surface antigen Omp85-like protein